MNNSRTVIFNTLLFIYCIFAAFEQLVIDVHSLLVTCHTCRFTAQFNILLHNIVSKRTRLLAIIILDVIYFVGPVACGGNLLVGFFFLLLCRTCLCRCIHGLVEPIATNYKAPIVLALIALHKPRSKTRKTLLFVLATQSYSYPCLST